jgi:hypothetical protein
MLPLPAKSPPAGTFAHPNHYALAKTPMTGRCFLERIALEKILLH